MAKKKKNNKKGKAALHAGSKVGSRAGARGGPRGPPLATRASYLQRKPVYKRTDRGLRISHTEFIKHIVVDGGATASPYEVERFALNPAYADTHPWLAEEAKNWEFYRYHRVAVHYIPATSATTSGALMMAPDYDPSDPDPLSAAELLVATGATDGNVWSHQTMRLDPRALNNFALGGHGYYVAQIQPGGVSGSDIRLIDAGVVFLAHEGVASAITTAEHILGSLFIEYDVEFSVPNSRSRLYDTGTFTSPRYPEMPLMPKASTFEVASETVPNGVTAPIIVAGPKMSPGYSNGTFFSQSLDFLSGLANWFPPGVDTFFRLGPGHWDVVYRTGIRLLAGVGGDWNTGTLAIDYGNGALDPSVAEGEVGAVVWTRLATEEVTVIRPTGAAAHVDGEIQCKARIYTAESIYIRGLFGNAALSGASHLAIGTTAYQDAALEVTAVQ